jgi:hypothetical protein
MARDADPALDQSGPPLVGRTPLFDDINEEIGMTTILIPVDGSTQSRHALQHVIRRACQEPGTEVHLL